MFWIIIYALPNSKSCSFAIYTHGVTGGNLFSRELKLQKWHFEVMKNMKYGMSQLVKASRLSFRQSWRLSIKNNQTSHCSLLSLSFGEGRRRGRHVVFRTQ